MKISVLGAGAIGTAVACDLAEREEVSHIQVIDNKPSALARVEERIDAGKLRVAQVDVRDARRVASVVAGSACVVSSASPRLHPKLARAALSVGAHFCDLGGDAQAAVDGLSLDDAARERSRWVVPNCGFAPGLINLLVMRGIAEFDDVENVGVRAGFIPVEVEPPFYHRLAYSAEKLIEDYTAPVPAIRAGEVAEVEPLTGLETVRFREPFGELEAFFTSGKLSTLPIDLVGRVRNLDFKSLRHPGHAAAIRSVLALGFGEDRYIDVRTHLTYRDILARRMRQELGGPFKDAVLLRVRITGTREGEMKTLVYELVEESTESSSAAHRCTGIPTAAIVMLLASGQVPGGGAAPPERIIPHEPFFAALEQRGLHIERRWEIGEEIPAHVDHGTP